MASANASPNYLPAPIINTWVVATAYIHMAAVATLSLVALAVVIAAVVVLVAGAVVAEDSPETLVANALGGEKFAQDVVAVQAKASISRVISSIESGEVTLPDGLSKDQAIDLLSNALQRHMICTN